MSRLIRLAAVLLGCLLASPGFAAPTAPGGDGPASATLPGSDKITISGDHFVVDDAKHQAIFSGNVVTVQSEVTVHSDQVVTSYGQGGASNISTFEATGHVKLVTKDQTATGERAVFDPKTHMLTLTGNVVVTNKTGQVQSTQLVVDLRKKKSTFTSKGGRVTGVFTSE